MFYSGFVLGPTKTIGSSVVLVRVQRKSLGFTQVLLWVQRKNIGFTMVLLSGERKSMGFVYIYIYIYIYILNCSGHPGHPGTLPDKVSTTVGVP